MWGGSSFFLLRLFQDMEGSLSVGYSDAGGLPGYPSEEALWQMGLLVDTGVLGVVLLDADVTTHLLQVGTHHIIRVVTNICVQRRINGAGVPITTAGGEQGQHGDHQQTDHFQRRARNVMNRIRSTIAEKNVKGRVEQFRNRES